MRWFIAAVALAFTACASSPLQVRELEIHYQYFHPSSRILEIYGFTPKESVNLGLDVDLGGPLYWNNEIRSLTDDGGYRGIGWAFSLGVHVFRNLDVEYAHLSEHYIDHDQSGFPGGRFPIRNSLGFRWRLIGSDSPTKPLF